MEALQEIRKAIVNEEEQLKDYCFQVQHAYCVAHDLSELEKRFDHELEPQLLDTLYQHVAAQRVAELEAVIASSGDQVNYKRSVEERLALLQKRIEFELSDEFVHFKRQAFKAFLKHSS